MIALLVLALISWDRVLIDCLGGQETMGYYYFQATMRQTVSVACLDEGGNPSVCQEIIAMPPIRFTGDIPDPGVGTDVSTTYDPISDPNLLPTPPIGGLAAWPWRTADNNDPVVAVDAAGNSSKECAP